MYAAIRQHLYQASVKTYISLTFIIRLIYISLTDIFINADFLYLFR